MEKNLVRLLFGAVVAMLAAQGVFVSRFGEPYPAIVMPGFGGSGGYEDGKVRIRSWDTVFVTDAGEESVPPPALFGDIPDSHHATLASAFLSPAAASDPANAASLAGRLRRKLFPFYRYGSAHRLSPENRASLQEWLRGRAAALLPGRTVRRAEFRWYDETRTVAGGSAGTTREPAGVFVVGLDGGPE